MIGGFSTEQAFGIKVTLGIMLGLGLVVWFAIHQRHKILSAIDVYLGTVLGAILGARLFYVIHHANFFWESPLSIPRLWFAELAWQGAVIGGLLALWGMCRWRGIEWSDMADGIALALPVAVMAIAWASRSAGLLLGRPVGDLTTVPVWSASFLPDLHRDVAARYELQMLVIFMGLIILLVVTALALTDSLAKQRLWIVLGLIGLMTWIVSQFSAMPPDMILGISLDRLSAIVLIIVSGVGLSSVNHPRNTQPRTAGSSL